MICSKEKRRRDNDDVGDHDGSCKEIIGRWKIINYVT
jgi:hypothetical protein